MKSLATLIILLVLAGLECATPDVQVSNLQIADMIQPTPRHSVLSNDGYYVWGASMVQTDDGICHLFYSRWPKPFSSWITDSEIAYATSDNPSGPYQYQSTVLAKRDAKFWDNVSVYNPQVIRANDKYYLYYTGNNGHNRLRVDENGKRISQRIGVAVADSPTGPWSRPDSPLIDISEEGIDSNFVTNPAVTRTKQGTYLMVYKCAGGNGRGRVYHTVAQSTSPEGPFVKTQKIIFDQGSVRFPAEDPFIWYHNDRYYAVVKEMGRAFSTSGKALLQFESQDGLQWILSSPSLVSERHILWDDGEDKEVDWMDRPQIWMQDGQPAILFLAIREGDHSYNVHVPLSLPAN
jgi:predicted GH43/DUF377 family glycosyl hydrolase